MTILEKSLQQQQMRVIFIGATATGKTSLIQRCISDEFGPTQSTLAMTFQSKTVELPERRVRVDLMDTCSMEQFDSITPQFYRSADAVALVCSVDQIESLARARYWLGQIMQYADQRVKIYYILNKIDLKEENFPVAAFESMAVAQNGSVIKVSAKTGEGVSQFLSQIATEFQPAVFEQPEENDVVLVRDPGQQRNRGCCK